MAKRRARTSAKLDDAPRSKLQRISDSKRPAQKAQASALCASTQPSQDRGVTYVFGTGDCGQLGLGEDVPEKLRPGAVALPNDEQAIAVTAGGMHTLCLSSANTLYSWGVNDEAALGRPAGGEPWSTSSHKGPMQTSDVPVAVDMPSSAGTLTAISAGDSHSAVLTGMGQVYTWGTFRDDAGVMGFSVAQRFALTAELTWAPATHAQQVVEIASGCDHVVARCVGGAVLTWGSGKQGQLGRIGTRHSDRALDSMLDLVTTPAEMHIPLSLRSKPASIACGWYSTFVVLENGQVLACGLNNYGQLGFASGNCSFAPKRVAALRGVDVVEVASGQHHTLARARSGKVRAFGRPTYGRLGLKLSDLDTDEPIRKAGELNIEDLEGAVTGIAAGDAVSACFSSQMCGLFLCGSNTSGMLAKGNDEDDEGEMLRVKRTKAFNEVTIVHVSLGGQHAVALGLPTGSVAG